MKRLFTWKVMRRLLIGFAALITLVAVVWAVENFRGHRAWNQYKGELVAKGEKLDLKSFVPPPVPDEKNFALASFFTNLDFQITPYHTSQWLEVESKVIKRDIAAVGIDRTDGNDRKIPKRREELNDLVVWQDFYRGNTNYPQPAIPQTAAEDVLVALSRFDAELDTLHKDAQERPLSRFPIRYEDGIQLLLPHLATMKGLVKVLNLRGTAYLELNRSDEAFRDLQLAIRITDSIKDEPLLISYLVRAAMLNIDTAFVKEGLVRHAWNEPQLKWLQGYFAQTDLLSDYHFAMRGERAFCLDLLEALKRGDYTLSEFADPSQTTDSPSMKWFLPSGWIKQNQRHIAKLHQDFTLAAVDPKGKRVFPEIITRGEERVTEAARMFPNPHTIFSRLLFPAVVNVSKRAAQNQTLIDQTMLACALERYYLANKTYPNSLQDLVPQFVTSLPNDVITGAPVQYQRTANDFYKLYSAGWDGKDDGGIPTPARPAKSKDTGTDWVWQFPEN